MIGEILGNRYEIEEKIGEGGMSVVYKARCNKLNRYVAVKVLKKEMSDNEDIVNKFKREATAIAALSDNNIVNILDVGSQDDINYIVMEYVKGKTLKELIKQFGKLNYETAITIAIQIAKALECAHKNNIIHRDVKPQNILVTEEGLIKVTDFGIAKSTSSATLTNTTTIMGSAHYFSPEQAKGTLVDNRTDLYSLGVVLYEMVTGRVPFEADSPVTIALKHIQEEVVPPKQINSKIPESLNKLIIKAMEKDPGMRYQNARDIINDLQKIKEDPNAVIKDVVENEENEHTIIMGSVNAPDNTKSVNKALEDEYYEDDEDDEYYDDDYYDEDDDDDEYDGKKKKKKSYKNLIIGVAVVLGLLLLGVGAFAISGGFSGTKTVKVPDLKGMTLEEAKKAIEDAGLEYVDAGTEKSDEEEGTVIKFDPEAGKEVEKGSEVRVITSAGVTKIKMPNLVEETEADAKATLDKLNLKNYDIKYEFSDDIEKGKVISTNPEKDKEITEDAAITIVVSEGKKTTYQPMPDLIGKDRDEAIRELTKLNLDGSVVGEVEVTDEKLVGKIAWTSHAYGTSVAEGTKIQLKIGKLKEEKVFVDSFIKVGMKASDAKKALEDAGFTKVVINGDSNGVVVKWDPPEAITKSTKVTIFSEKVEEQVPPADPKE
ncbi:MAG: Stk1 family PASTA domain-containing Ser/Thr kinase [Clostridium sp.]|uniref:non-specific serine/threonine protein kinase n=1 Tax=Clostridium paraputrificum TaxID=29363 RepID=A0A6N2YUD8_9CLOT|nr:Stk1 family PASTA domain-containing Ser/Thr kinase [Clostridium sp.]MBS5926067.1 Stk1 family PASTA domain-containing Ser/Thr kinase [Clostridium sp.]